jgi:hypothetical protein
MLLHNDLRKPSYTEGIIWTATIYYKKRKRNDGLNSMQLDCPFGTDMFQNLNVV